LIPILNRLEGKNLYITQNLTKLPGYFVEDEISAKEQIVEPKQEEEKEITPKDNVAKDLVKDLSGEIKTKTKIDDDGTVNVEINTNQLKKVLKNYDIDDPTILSNVKTAIDKYLSKDKGKLKQDEAEILILKAINKTIHGTEELREKYVDNPKKRWKYVLRVKRGLGDTSQPGGLYKDQVYLEGAIKILKNRKDINFKLFYCGKINIEDIKRPKFIK
jgi:hypothetical protein